MIIEPIAHVENDYKEKFGIPRQSGLVESLISRIVFEPEYRNPDAFRGIEGYSHLWRENRRNRRQLRRHPLAGFRRSYRC